MEVMVLDHYFRKPSKVDRIRANLLAPQIEHYAQWMTTRNAGGLESLCSGSIDRARREFKSRRCPPSEEGRRAG
jgi:hypothetical protein